MADRDPASDAKAYEDYKAYQAYQQYQDYQKYLDHSQGSSGDEPQAPTMSTGHAGLIGAENGAVLGLRPAIAGLGAAGAGALSRYSSERDQGHGVIDSLKGAYEEGKEDLSQGRNEANVEQETAAKEHPVAYYGGNIAGGAPIGTLLPGGSLKAAAQTGALYGAGNALSSAHSTKEAAEDVAAGAVAGPVLHGATKLAGSVAGSAYQGVKSAGGWVGEQLGKVFNGSASQEEATNIISQAWNGFKDQVSDLGDKASGYLENKSNLSTYKSLGPYANDVKNKSPEEMADIGSRLRKVGLLNGGPKSYEGLADRANELLTQKGKEMDLAMGSMVAAGEKMAAESTAKGVPATAGVKRQLILDGIQKQLFPENTDPHLPIPSLFNKDEKLMGLFKQVSQGGESIPLSSAQSVKVQIGNLLDKRNVWNSLKSGKEISNPENQFLVAYYHSLNDNITAHADALSDMMGKDVAGQWVDLKKDYAALKTASIIASRRAGKEFVNRNISPSDYFMGLEGMRLAEGSKSDKSIIGLAAGLANHFGRKYGNQVLSNAYGAAAQPAQSMVTGPLTSAASRGVQQTMIPQLNNSLINGDMPNGGSR